MLGLIYVRFQSRICVVIISSPYRVLALYIYFVTRVVVLCFVKAWGLLVPHPLIRFRVGIEGAASRKEVTTKMFGGKSLL